MAWTQDDIVTVYRAVKEIAAEVYTPHKSKSQIISEIRWKLRRRFGLRNFRGHSSRYVGVFDNEARSQKKFKRFVKSKYDQIGLRSKEADMVSNMIESVVDSLECNEISLNDLEGSVARMDVLTSRVKGINTDCNDIMHALEKISVELESPCQGT